LDEAGTPFCITVDFDGLEDDSVTVRHRDTMAQERVSIAQLPVYLSDQMKAWETPTD
jgi:glycyl-tRNA synthetase